MSVDHSPNLLVLCVGCVGIEAFTVGESLLLDKIFHHVTGISGGSCSHLLSVVITTGDRVRLSGHLLGVVISTGNGMRSLLSFWLDIFILLNHILQQISVSVILGSISVGVHSGD